MNEMPLVSVLMTAYNREKYIAEAIESVLASDYTNFELIISDDAFTNNIVQIALYRLRWKHARNILSLAFKKNKLQLVYAIYNKSGFII